jgi:hypothetical protein
LLPRLKSSVAGCRPPRRPAKASRIFQDRRWRSTRHSPRRACPWDRSRRGVVRAGAAPVVLMGQEGGRHCSQRQAGVAHRSAQRS